MKNKHLPNYYNDVKSAKITVAEKMFFETIGISESNNQTKTQKSQTKENRTKGDYQ